MKMKFDIEGDDEIGVGWSTWRFADGRWRGAHARTGDAAKIGGYMGKSEAFEDAIGKFAVAYADQTEKDFEVLVKAIRAGRVKAERGGEGVTGA